MHRMGVTVGLQTLWGGAEKEQIRGRKPCGNPEVGATPRGMWGAGPGEVLCAADFAGPWMGWGHLWGACHDPPPGRSPHPGPPGLAHPSLPLLRGLRCGDAGQEEGGVSPKNWGRLVFRDSPCEGPQRGEQHVRGPRLRARWATQRGAGSCLSAGSGPGCRGGRASAGPARVPRLGQSLPDRGGPRLRPESGPAGRDPRVWNSSSPPPLRSGRGSAGGPLGTRPPARPRTSGPSGGGRGAAGRDARRGEGCGPGAQPLHLPSCLRICPQERAGAEVSQGREGTPHCRWGPPQADSSPRWLELGAPLCAPLLHPAEPPRRNRGGNPSGRALGIPQAL